MNDQITYEAGTKRCYRCGDPINEPITCSKDTNRFRCSKEECRAPRGAERAHCFHCAEYLGYRRPTPTGAHFCYTHHAAERQIATESSRCRNFLHLYQIYLGYVRDPEKPHYRDAKGPLQTLREFFSFLNAKGISDIQEVDTDVISEYCSTVRGGGLDGEEWDANIEDAAARPGEMMDLKRPKLCRPDFLKVFFEFLRLRGLYLGKNPVDKSHYRKKRKSSPKVYSEKEKARLWQWLHERGDARARLVIALVEEAGLLPSALCSLQIGDIDVETRTIKVRRNHPMPDESEFLPYPAFFHRKTSEYLEAWMHVRPKCAHDCLLTNARGGPLGVRSLNNLLNQVFLKKFHPDGDGLEEFELDRLRNGLIAHLRKRGMKDEAVMRMTGIQAKETIKRFDRVVDREKIDRARKAS